MPPSASAERANSPTETAPSSLLNSSLASRSLVWEQEQSPSYSPRSVSSNARFQGMKEVSIDQPMRFRASAMISTSKPAKPSSLGCSILCGGKLLQARRTLDPASPPPTHATTPRAKPKKPAMNRVKHISTPSSNHRSADLAPG